ncbi:MAG: hypothetical protein EAZ51_07965 [Sphingobacteriales bacterium]|nr:MAG: hypothetical protein EAZ51_07965 [Sphingobacteriales bacterium]
MKIILISPFPPAQNPRLVKEYKTFKAKGYEVKVLYGSRDKWANYFREDNPDFILIGGIMGSLTYLFTRVIFRIFIKPFSKSFSVNAISFFQYLYASKLKADIYIGHNLAALPLVVKLAKRNKTKCGFDAEDFHRQEINNDKNSNEYTLAKYLEDNYLPQLNYFTSASPLIAAEYKKLYPQLNPIIINNVFSSNFIVKSNKENETLKLFWFSQTIGKNRGLETVIQAIGLLNNPNITLTLLGMLSTIDEIYFRNFATEKGLILNQLIFLSPVAPDNIFSIASQYDIGLALELNTPLNRDICLTNKIFTYLSAGLAIIASETAAQKQFLNNYPLVGKSFPIGDINALAKIIELYIQNPNVLLSTKIAAFNLAKNELNWENEIAKFLLAINTSL